ncbi:MAG TPA: EAL domain-containing protein [Blastocatellia bacterium]|nr:EAL domain-containing protein [Blastocatellia bacterium]
MDLVNRQKLVKPYMLSVITAGVVVFTISLLNLSVYELGLQYILLMVITCSIGPRVIINFFRFKSCVSISDVFIFLTMFLFGGDAAIVLGTLETAYSSLRISKKAITIAFNAASMTISTSATLWALRLTFGDVAEIGRSEYSSKMIIATCAMAFSQYIINSGLIAIAGALRANKPIFTTWREHYIWTSISYFAGASAASIIAKMIGVVGFYAFIAVMPIVAIVYFTYLTYLKNVEASATQAEQAEQHLAQMLESEERFRSAFDHAPIGMALVGHDGRWLQVNRSLCEILGYTEDEFLGMNFQAITCPDDLGDFLTHVNEVLEGKTATHQMEKRYFHKLGHEVWVLTGISLIRDSQSRSQHIIFQIQDITNRKRAEEQLVHEALHDALTGLPNRAYFMDQLQISLEEVKNSKDHLFAVLFLDLDRFKLINDSIGHMIGDQLLIGIAHRLRKCLRPGDKVARLGGDEFTILLDGIRDASEAIEVADRIQKQVSHPFNLGGYETFTTASIGIALSNIGYERPEDLLRDADTAMYQAKSLGKARYVIFDQGMHAHAMNLLQLETDLRRAIDRKEFFIHYQPIVSLETGKLSGFEALVRWQHPERGLIPPENFIAVAEETGFIVPIGQWVLREACRQMRTWQDRISPDLSLSMSVNLSGKQFAHTNLIDQIVNILEVTGLDPRRLKLEITESVVMENIEVATRMLEQLRALGVELSIDDFGTGYSSLSYLHRLPIDTLKIDRSFVSRISENNENREIVRTILMLAQNLGMGVVAEGVETREQLESLQELKCDRGQGYLFSRPVNALDAERLILSFDEWQPAIFCADERPEKDVFPGLASTYPM